MQNKRRYRQQPNRRDRRPLSPELLESRVMLDGAGLPGEVCYRVNVGGMSLPATPSWTADSLASPSPYVNSVGGNSFVSTTTQPVDLTDLSIPQGTPAALFSSDRFDLGGGTEMQWDFTVESGWYEVRLYFADTFSGTQAVGARQFDVAIEGDVLLDDYDIVEDVGGFTGVMKSFLVNSDANLDIDFIHVTENPTLRGIEILVAAQPDGVLAASTSVVDFGVVEVDAISQSVLTLTNSGGASASSITIDPSTAISLPNGSPFSALFVQATPIVLAPGESTDVSLTYAPLAEGSAAALLSIAHDGTNSPVEISLTGVGAGAGQVLYRVNAGEDALVGSPSWSADTFSSPSVYLSSSSTNMGTYAVAQAIDMSHPSLPSDVPMALFQSERFDLPGSGEMSWAFDVAPGTYNVRLYFAEILPYLQFDGGRVFDVAIEGDILLDDVDIFNEVGANAAIMKSLVVTTSDSSLDIDFLHVNDNPSIKGIEIISVSSESVDVSTTALDFGSVDVNATADLPVVITNNTLDDLTIDPAQSAIAPGGTPFTFAYPQATPIVLAPGETTTVTVSYAPTAVATDSGQLSIVHSGSNSPLIISLDGSGVDSTTVNFTKSTLTTLGALFDPTKLEFGPDGRLYVSELGGTIQVMTVVRNGPNDYEVVENDTLFDIKNTLNHNDQGIAQPGQLGRLITGLLVTGTAENPVIFVSHSDPRFGGGPDGLDLNLDTNSGMVSRLTFNGSSWDRLDLVRGLPRSEENHGTNGLELDPVENILYLAVGGHTNMGARSTNFALLPEYALSAAVLSIDLDAIGETTYDLPTLDDETRPGATDFNDPFGGNDGLNQAKLVPGGPVQVYAPGFRNPYDILLTTDGLFVTIDNGPNADWGDVPVNEGPAGNATNDINEPGTSYGDGFHIITGQGYYGGHPNPTRSNPANTFNASNPQSPVSVGNPIESDYQIPGVENNAYHVFGSSTNGLVEYTATNFGGALTGDVLTASYDNTIYRIKINATGDGVDLVEPLFSNVGAVPLDVTAPIGTFGGTVWVTDIGTNQVYVFEPSGGGVGNPDDLDGDGYTNDDEIANGTDPQNGADVPADNDIDFVSDLLDEDDDNDLILDVDDAFAIDEFNGSNIPVGTLYTWENDSPPAGKLLGLGFTGLMHNGTTDWLDQFDKTALTPGGAAGVLTIDSANSGTAFGTTNTQEQAFQFGVNVGGETLPYAARTRLVGPFSGLTPVAGQQMGIYVGTGDQDNYVSLTLTGDAGGSIRLIREVAGVVTDDLTTPLGVALPGPSAIDLWLSINPQTNLLQASYSINQGVRTNVFGELAVPPAWIAASLAVGLMSEDPTDSGEMPVTWDFLGVVTEPLPPTDASALVEVDFPTTFASGAFRITNTSPSGEMIESVVIDLSTSFMPDVVFDPTGDAGDVTGKVFTPDAGEVATGLLSHSFAAPRGGGFDQIEIFFSDFGPGETFTFSIDTDPTSINGAAVPGPSDTGSISGMELSGATSTILFDDNAVLSGQLFSVAGSQFTSRLTLNDDLPAAPSIALVGLSALPAVVFDEMQVVEVSGPVGADVRLLVAEGGLFLAGVPGGGFDIDPFEINTVLQFTEYTGVVGPGGTVAIPVTLQKSAPEAGYNYLFAVVEDAAGATSELSNIAVVEYNDDPPPEVLYRVNAGGSAIAGTPGWAADPVGAPSTFNNAGAALSFTTDITATVDTSALPQGTPAELFATERWDLDAAEELMWEFPVTAGQYEVRLYFAESFDFGQQDGFRVFDVLIEGNPVLEEFDIFAVAGGYTAIMRSFVVTSDAVLNIDFIHGVENPIVNAIEILAAAGSGPSSAIGFGSTAPLASLLVSPPTDETEATSTQAVTAEPTMAMPFMVEEPLASEPEANDQAVESLFATERSEDESPDVADESLELAFASPW